MNLFLCAGAIFTGMPVSTVAEAMLQDAWANLTKPSEAASNVAVFDNAAIYKLAEVSAIHCAGTKAG